MKRLLIQTQLSSYNAQGIFDLATDSGWQMVMGRVRQMLKLNPDLCIDVMGPIQSLDVGRQLIELPKNINPDLWRKFGQSGENRLNYIQHKITPNAVVTRYDFDILGVCRALNLVDNDTKYDAVYINDPMHLRNFKTMFHVYAGYQPKFYVHSHFVDSPACPKFDPQVSLWHGQVEASIKADWNFWQCQSALSEFEIEARKLLRDDVVDSIMAKSEPWDDGYSIEEISTTVDVNNLRFTEEQFREKTKGKIVIFVPNRVGGKGRSSDYTNCGKFLFDMLPELAKNRDDFVVIAGNPNQKFRNSELEALCGQFGYVNLVSDSFTRDEFKYVARNSHIALGLYDQDTYGGTVARECVELGCLPVWPMLNEYAEIAKSSNKYHHMCKGDFSDLNTKLSILIKHCKHYGKESPWLLPLQTTVRNRCSYEHTTLSAMERMNIL